MPEPNTPGDTFLDQPGEHPMPGVDVVDQSNLAVAMTGMANEFAASAARRTNRADQTGADSSAMWAISMQTPSQNAALALRTATESGSGRTRAETNQPDQTGAGAPR